MDRILGDRKCPLSGFGGLMKIKVTQKHIDFGVRGSPYRCPVAWAISDTVNKDVDVLDDKYLRVSVGGRMVGLKDKAGTRDFNVPEEARAFVLNFDFGYRVFPFEFDIDAGTDK